MGYVQMETGLFGNNPVGDVQFHPEFGGGNAPYGQLKDLAGKFWGRETSGSVFDPADISGLDANIQNFVIADTIDYYLNPRGETRWVADRAPLRSKTERRLDQIQGAADVAGAAIDVLDVPNAVLYGLRGKWRDAGTSLIATAPVVGSFAKFGEKGLSKLDEAGKGYDMALGLARHTETGSPFLLRNFKNKVGALDYGDIYKSWWPGSYEKLQGNIVSAMGDAKTLHFNLDQVDMEMVRRYARNPKSIEGNITNWELTTILSNPDLLKKTTFYGPGGKIVSASEILGR